MSIKKLCVFVLTVFFCLTLNAQKNTAEFFKTIKNKRIESDPSVVWKNFGPGMSGYCEEFWCHPTDENVMFMGPDMHVSFGTWDGGASWHTIKDSDGLGQDMKRVLDIEFSLQNPDFGMSIDWNGWIFKTENKGKSWKKIGAFGKSYKDVGIDPNDPKSFAKGWYYEQKGTRHSELAVDPNNDNVWYVGAGDFWNVKSNHRSKAKPNGIHLKYAAYGYIWKTTDKGKNWKKITAGLPENTEVGKIIVNPKDSNKLIMATNVGVLLSEDGGLSWENKAKGLPNNLPRDLTSFYNKKTKEFILYLVDQTVYVPKGNSTLANGGVYKSTDGGVTWKSITGNLGINLNKISFAPEIDRYYRTISYWFGIDKNKAKQKFSELPENTLPVYNRLVVNPLNKNEIYVSYNKKHDFTFGSGDVWKTEDGGKTWFACARQGMYWKNAKDNAYWKSRNNPTGTNVEFAHLQTYMDNQPARSGNRMMVINNKGNVFIGIDQQTLKTTNGGKSWKQVDDYETSKGSNKWIGRGGSNLPGRFMLHETGIKGRRLLCSGEHGLWQTTDLDGWSDKQAVAVKQIEGQVHDHSKNHGAHSVSTVAVHPNNPEIIYILAWRQEHRGKLRRSTDGGKTWENIATIFDNESPEYRNVAAQNALTIDPENPNNMYFCSTYVQISEVGGGKGPNLTKGGYGFYKSTDGGYTWKLSNKGFHDKFSIRRIKLHPDHPETIYAASNDNNGGLYRSTDKGENWKKLKIPSQIKAVNNVFIDRNTKHIYISAGRRSGTYEEGGVWRSKNNGETWEQIFKAPVVWQVETSPLNPDLLVLSAAGQAVSKSHEFMNPGVYISKNGGNSWSKINKGLGQPDKIVDVKPDPYNEDVLWCASWGCGWFVAYLNDSKTPWLNQ